MAYPQGCGVCGECGDDRPVTGHYSTPGTGHVTGHMTPYNSHPIVTCIVRVFGQEVGFTFAKSAHISVCVYVQHILMCSHGGNCGDRCTGDW